MMGRYPVLVFVFLAAITIRLASAEDAQRRKQQYLELARRIAPYHAHRLGANRPGAPLFTPEGHEGYSKVLAQEFTKTFTLSEVEEIAKFYESAVGRKCVAFELENKAWERWLLQTHSAKTWTCVMHPEIQTAKQGKCPKCGMELLPLVAKPEGEISKQRKKPERSHNAAGLQALLDDTDETLNEMTEGNFTAACINVTRQAQKKDITMFAAVAVDAFAEQVNGCRIEVVRNSRLIAKHKNSSGTYPNHHNGMVLAFAAVQYLEGDKTLGLRLVQILSEIDPTLEWSSPTLGNRSIQSISKALEANDGSMDDFLREEKLQWARRILDYGMPQPAD